jgi:hypothetical protein
MQAMNSGAVLWANIAESFGRHIENRPSCTIDRWASALHPADGALGPFVNGNAGEWPFKPLWNRRRWNNCGSIAFKSKRSEKSHTVDFGMCF